MKNSASLVDATDPVSMLLARFSERRFATYRMLGLVVVLLWSIVGGTLPGHDSANEAVLLVPWALACLAASAAWWLLLRAHKSTLVPPAVANVVGDGLNILIIGLLMDRAFYLVPALVLGLPVVSVMATVRYGKYGRGIFWLTVVVGAVMTFMVAPEHFWLLNPGYVLLTLVLLVGLPIVLASLVSALHRSLVTTLAAKGAQERFVAIMSHELRTPITSIITSAELLDPEELPASQQSLIAAVRAGASSLKSRVDTLLDAGALAHGSVTVRPVPTCFEALMRGIRETWQPVAGKASVKLSVDVRRSVPAPVLMADAGLVEQVINNLVQNAIRYTPPGGTVTVCAELAPADNAAMVFTCRVRDTGLGVSDETKERIFEAFQQSRGGEGQEAHGFGLGLYIVRRISDLMHATVGVADNLGGGSVFTWSCAFPLAAGIAPQVELDVPAALERHHRLQRPLRILVVDDNVSNQLAIEAIMVRAGHAVRRAASAPAASLVLKEGWPQLVALDLHLAGESGLVWLRRWRQTYAELPPVVIITGADDVDAAADAKLAGAVGFFTKPVSISRVLALIESVTRHQGPASSGAQLPREHAPQENNPLAELRALGGRQQVADYLVAAHEGLTQHLSDMECLWPTHGYAGTRSALHALRNEFLSMADRDGVEACEAWSAQAAAVSDGDDVNFEPLRTRVFLTCNNIAAQPEFPTSKLLRTPRPCC